MKSPLPQLLLASAASVVLVAVYGFWYAEVESKSATVAYLEGQILRKNETVGRIASARASLAEIADSEARVHGHFVPETGIVAFINSLEQQGRAQGTSVSVLSVSTSVVEKRSVLSLSLSIKGTFDAVMRTVGLIEYAPYDIAVSALSVGKDDENAWHADLGLRVGSIPADNATGTP